MKTDKKNLGREKIKWQPQENFYVHELQFEVKYQKVNGNIHRELKSIVPDCFKVTSVL